MSLSSSASILASRASYYISESGSTSEQSSPVGLPTAVAPRAVCRLPESIAAKTGDGSAIFDNVKSEILRVLAEQTFFPSLVQKAVAALSSANRRSFVFCPQSFRDYYISFHSSRVLASICLPGFTIDSQ